MKRKSVKVATISGAYLRKVAASMCSRMLRNNRSSVKQQKQIDGYLVRAEKKGDIARGEVVDLPGLVAIPGASNTLMWPFRNMPPWQSGLCKMIPAGRDAFLIPGVTSLLDVLSGTAVIAPPVWSGDPPDPANTTSMTWGVRPAAGAGACITTTAIEVDTSKVYPFAYGTGRVWLMVGYANPTTTRDTYRVGEDEPLETVRGDPTIGVCLELSAVLAPLSAVAHPARPAGGWSDIAANTEAAIAWAFASPFASETRHPNFWALTQVTRQQSGADYRGRRCLLILRVTGIADDGSYSLGRWLVDPATAYPGRAGFDFNYHLPSSPIVLSDGSLIAFDPYQSHMSEGGVTYCRYTLGLVRVTAAGTGSGSILHTSDIAIDEEVSDVALAQYHFEGADVSEDDTVVGMCFGYEFAEAPTVTVHRIGGDGVTSVTLDTVGFVRCMHAVMSCHSGFFSGDIGHWAIHLLDAAHSTAMKGVSAGADKVTYIGNNKWIVYVSTDPQVISYFSGTSGSLAVAIYDDTTKTISLAGVIRPYAGSSAGATARIGRMDCVVKERADENGVVVRKATLLASFGSGTWFAGNSGINAGLTFISHDSGATWEQLINYGGSPGGAAYCGNLLEPRTEPISRGLR